MRALVCLIFCFAASVAHAEEKKYIVFFGDSLTAGYGLTPEESYPALIQNKLPADYQIQNSGVSGDTTTDGLRRIKWAVHHEPSIFVLALGANDGLRGLDPALIEKNLREIVSVVRTSWPSVKIVIAGMELPSNMGPEYLTQFREVFPRVAKELDLAIVPFLLEGVAGDAALNQPDGIHPTAEGQKIVAENVWKVLQPLL